MTNKSPKVLAVDDENDILLIVKTALASEGFTVATASSGEDALAQAERRHLHAVARRSQRRGGRLGQNVTRLIVAPGGHSRPGCDQNLLSG